MGGRIKIRDINQDPADMRTASGSNSVLPGFSGGVQGSIAYRGASKWEILGPSTSGFALVTQGPGANPIWTLVTANIVGRATGKAATISASFSTAVV